MSSQNAKFRIWYRREGISQRNPCLENGNFRIAGALVVDTCPGSNRKHQVYELVIRLGNSLAVCHDSGIEIYPLRL